MIYRFEIKGYKSGDEWNVEKEYVIKIKFSVEVYIFIG